MRPFDFEHFCSDSLTFSWECTDYWEGQMLIQLTFDKPECVSAETNIGDSLEITFYDQQLFQDKQGRAVPPEYVISHPVSRQIRDEKELEIAQQMG